mgnify:CR=1 FL=1
MTLAGIFREEGRKEGIIKGVEQGIEREIEIGARKGEIEVAKRQIRMGLPIEQIMDGMDLPGKLEKR